MLVGVRTSSTLPHSPCSCGRRRDLVTPMSIRVAATLGLADHILAGATTAAALADATGTDRDALGRMLEHLVIAGIMERTADGGYALTELGEQLTGGPSQQRPRLAGPQRRPRPCRSGVLRPRGDDPHG